MASASPTFWQQMPDAPPISCCRWATSAHLWEEHAWDTPSQLTWRCIGSDQVATGGMKVQHERRSLHVAETVPDLSRDEVGTGARMQQATSADGAHPLCKEELTVTDALVLKHW